MLEAFAPMACSAPAQLSPLLSVTLPPSNPVPPGQCHPRVTPSRRGQCSAGASWRRQEAKIHHHAGLRSILQLANVSLEVHCSGDKTEYQGKTHYNGVY